MGVFWQRAFDEEDRIARSTGHGTLALSAFMLSSLTSPMARKNLVKEMWESGAHTIVFVFVLLQASINLYILSLQVLLDHNTNAGFEAIVEAREFLLKMGKKELDDSEAADWPVRGCHVVAPVSFPEFRAQSFHH